MVTELVNGDLSYWALHHPRPDRPDFTTGRLCTASVLAPLPYTLPLRHCDEVWT